VGSNHPGQPHYLGKQAVAAGQNNISGQTSLDSCSPLERVLRTLCLLQWVFPAAMTPASLSRAKAFTRIADARRTEHPARLFGSHPCLASSPWDAASQATKGPSVQEGKPGSHSSRWRRFTDAVIRIAAREPDRVFLLWGAHAQEKESIIVATSGSEANILKSSHPAPPACYRPCGNSPAFVKSRPFRNTNRLLKASGRGDIDWNLA